MSQKLNPQAQIILNILSDGQWHCPIDWGYSDGHGKRYTDISRYLRPLGKYLADDWCDCGRHVAKLKKRKIGPLSHCAVANTNYCCGRRLLGHEDHSSDCLSLKVAPKEEVSTLF